MVVSTSAIDCLERLVSEMTCYVSSGTLNPTHSLTHLEERCGMDVQTVGVISQERLKIEVKLVSSDSRKSYIPRRLAQQQMTLSDLE